MGKGILFKKGNEPMYPCPYMPIGSLYFTTNNVNPSTYFGGSWERYGKGRTIVSLDENQTEFNAINKTGGTKTHTLIVDEMPSHNHSFKRNGNYSNGVMIDTGKTGQWGSAIIQVSGNYTAQPSSVSIDSTGGGKAHNNLQPYICVYVWRRIS